MEAQKAPDAPKFTTEHEIWGEPVAEELNGDEATLAFNSDDNEHRLFVARYEYDGSDWVKMGLDRHNVSNLFNEDTLPTN